MDLSVDNAPHEREEDGGELNVAYDIVAIVKQKIVFSKRPVPVVPSNMKG